MIKCHNFRSHSFCITVLIVAFASPYFLTGCSPKKDAHPPAASTSEALRPSDLVEFPAEGSIILDRLRATLEPLLNQKDYKAITSLAADLRTSRSHQASGSWELIYLYDTLSAPPDEQDEAAWPVREQNLTDWALAEPQNIVVHVALAEFWINYAWHARGTGYADTVGDNQWTLFKNRLEKAANQIKLAAKCPDRCPGFYTVCQTLALGQGWSHEQYDQLVTEAVAYEPSCTNFYLGKVWYLQTRWYGKTESEWLDYATQAANTVGGPDGDVLYARLAYSVFNAGSYKSVIRDSGLDWPRVRQGLEICEQRYPNSLWAKSLLCMFSGQKGDRPSAQKTFTELGRRVYTPIWSKERFLEDREWAFRAN